MSCATTCQVCHQQFSLNGPSPFLLPCFHAVCETCVISAAGGVISCSPCQKDVNLTETCLKKDSVREQEILQFTLQHNPELVLCTHEEDGNQAVCWCVECEEFLCEHCQMIHNSFKITKKHQVHDVKSTEFGKLNEDRYCTVHPKVLVDTWDNDCCMLTCGKCRRGDHAGHEVVDVEEATENARKDIFKFGNEIKPKVDQHVAHQAAVEIDLQSLDEKSATLDRKISFSFKSLKVQLDQREKELQIALQNDKEKLREQLIIKKKLSETCHQRCKTTSDYINKTLKYSSPHDMLELRKVLEEESCDCRSSALEDYNPLPLPMFHCNELERITSSIAHFGSISTTDAVVTNKREDKSRAEASFRYTVENISELEDTALSPPCMIQYLPWQIKAKVRRWQSAKGQKSLGFFLQCNADTESKSWSCNAEAELRILSYNPDGQIFFRKIQHEFNHKQDDWGFSCFISWAELFNPDNGYVKDNRITLEVYVFADVPRGV